MPVVVTGITEKLSLMMTLVGGMIRQSAFHTSLPWCILLMSLRVFIVLL